MKVKKGGNLYIKKKEKEKKKKERCLGASELYQLEYQ